VIGEPLVTGSDQLIITLSLSFVVIGAGYGASGVNAVNYVKVAD
jgi:hypothetical protein